jgi:pimeloyl-ACP methyl ester carboxylesterase
MTYLLLHGAWHGDTAHLLGPEIGLDTYVDDIAGLLLAEDLTDVVLVGHSYAGMVISGVANRVPERIARLVFLDAMVPRDGESAVDVLPVTQVLIDGAAAAGSGWRIPPMPEQPPPGGLFGVTEPDDVAWLRGILTDEPVRCMQQPVRLDNPAAGAIPRAHIHCVGRQPAGIVRRPVPAGQPVWELPTGHDCMITMPAELTDLLLKLGGPISSP